MLNRIISSIRRSREWRRDHEAAWKDAVVEDPSGLTPFQAECEKTLTGALGALGLTLTERTVEADRLGGSFVHARVGASQVEVWLYSDGAEVAAAGSGHRFERWDWPTPQLLCRALVGAVLKALAEQSAERDVRPGI